MEKDEAALFTSREARVALLLSDRGRNKACKAQRSTPEPM